MLYLNNTRNEQPSSLQHLTLTNVVFEYEINDEIVAFMDNI